MPDQLQTIVQRMIDAGEPEENIATVIQHFKTQAAPSNKAMTTEQLQAANMKGRTDLPSVSGFAGNVLESGGRFLSNAVSGIPTLAKMAGGALLANVDPNFRAAAASLVGQAAPRILSAAGQGIKKRYGGVDEALHTAYTDPVGVAADASTLAAGVGLAAKAAQAPKLARIAGAVSNATNPMSLVGRVAEPVAHGIANTVVRGTLRPPAAVRQDFGGSKAVADAVLKDRVYSEASASKKLGASVSKADQMLADAQQAGTPGVNTYQVAKSVMDKPQETAQLRARLGVPDESQGLADTASAIVSKNGPEIPLTDAQALKREAQALAYEAGANNLTVKKAAEIAKAKALRAGIEDRVPAVGPVNARSERLLGSTRAFAAAEDRPRALTNFLSVLGGGAGFAGAGPAGAAIMPLLIKAMDSPRAGAMTGIGINSLGQAANSDLAKAAIIARLMGEIPE